MDTSPPDSPPPGTRLQDIPGFPADLVAKLESRWLGTAEEVLGAVAPAGAADALRRFLDLDEARFAECLAQLRAVVPQERYARLMHPPTRPRGLGYRLPEAPLPPSPEPPALPRHEPDAP